MGRQGTVRRPHHDARPRPRLWRVKPVLLDSCLIQPKNAQSRAEKILQFLVKPHSVLTSRFILIPLQYDPRVLEFHGVFGIPPAAKSDQSATTMMDGVIRFPAERFDHAWPKSAWVPNS